MHQATNDRAANGKLNAQDLLTFAYQDTSESHPKSHKVVQQFHQRPGSFLFFFFLTLELLALSLYITCLPSREDIKGWAKGIVKVYFSPQVLMVWTKSLTPTLYVHHCIAPLLKYRNPYRLALNLCGRNIQLKDTHE